MVIARKHHVERPRMHQFQVVVDIGLHDTHHQIGPIGAGLFGGGDP